MFRTLHMLRNKYVARSLRLELPFCGTDRRITKAFCIRASVLFQCGGLKNQPVFGVGILEYQA